ncbi:MAG: MerR family transcriptional regulator [Jatrophihabitans sp.]|uniref:MerR family transcriptional regulator n=1 Tax=Jatrophihabitans sp. TaxID=1932789 RepID=UPI003F7FD2A2
MDDTEALTVGEVAARTGVSVRALHHYDEIGLLTPSARSASGYRLYTAADLDRLHAILVHRALDFGLADIAAMLADPDEGTDERLRRQHRLLRQRIDRQQALLAALEHLMEARAMGDPLSPEEQFEIFGTTDLAERQAEADSRWGDTDAWTESNRRTARYGKDDWLEIKADAQATVEAFAAVKRDGQPADGPTATALAEEHRAHIERWFYPCSHDLHRGLAELYVSDERFAANYDGVEPGLAAYVRAAIIANADAHPAAP